MKSNLAQLARNRKQLFADLSQVRRFALQASNRQDFRQVGKLTLEAARLNRALSDLEDAEFSAL